MRHCLASTKRTEQHGQHGLNGDIKHRCNSILREAGVISGLYAFIKINQTEKLIRHQKDLTIFLHYFRLCRSTI